MTVDAENARRLLMAHERELRAAGVESVSLFGSTARDEAGPASDVDVAVSFRTDSRVGAFGFAALSERLSAWLDRSVDLVGEPARKPAMQRAIDRDRLRVF